jgi:hypothetical protein
MRDANFLLNLPRLDSAACRVRILPGAAEVRELRGEGWGTAPKDSSAPAVFAMQLTGCLLGNEAYVTQPPENCFMVSRSHCRLLQIVPVGGDEPHIQTCTSRKENLFRLAMFAKGAQCGYYVHVLNKSFS